MCQCPPLYAGQLHCTPETKVQSTPLYTRDHYFIATGGSGRKHLTCFTTTLPCVQTQLIPGDHYPHWCIHCWAAAPALSICEAQGMPPGGCWLQAHLHSFCLSFQLAAVKHVCENISWGALHHHVGCGIFP